MQLYVTMKVIMKLLLLSLLGTVQGLAKSIKQGLRRMVEDICHEDPRRRTEPSSILS